MIERSTYSIYPLGGDQPTIQRRLAQTLERSMMKRAHRDRCDERKKQPVHSHSQVNRDPTQRSNNTKIETCVGSSLK